MRRFQRHIGIDYSGAGAPESPAPGIRVFLADVEAGAAEVPGPFGRDGRWSRKALAAWLEDRLREEPPTVVGIDHALSFPRHYFERHRLPPDWDAFLDDFGRHWPTDRDGQRVRDLRLDPASSAAARLGDARWRRETDRLCRAKSVFHFGVPGSVADSTHSGIPWIRRLRRPLAGRVHFWPFDGWEPPVGRHVLAEAYPALYGPTETEEPADEHRRDARRIASWLLANDEAGTLSRQFVPALPSPVAGDGRIEGWILGVHPGAH